MQLLAIGVRKAVIRVLEVYLVRHGRTQMNRKGLLQGRGSDLPLDEAGERQARAAGAWAREQGIAFDHVVSSPLRRAVRTACLVAGVDEARVVRDDLLLEMDYGPYEGYDMSAHDPAMDSFFADFVHNPAPAGMEPLAHVQGRAGRFLEGLASSGLDGRVLVSTHAIVLKGALEALDPAAGGSWWARYVGNCWVYRSEARPDGGLGSAELVFELPR